MATPFPSSPDGELLKAYHGNKLLFSLAKNGASMEEIIVTLCHMNEVHLRDINELHSYAPKKITFEGRSYIWHCPDNLIPNAEE